MRFLDVETNRHRGRSETVEEERREVPRGAPHVQQAPTLLQEGADRGEELTSSAEEAVDQPKVGEVADRLILAHSGVQELGLAGALPEVG
jgi:hypothetical protein